MEMNKERESSIELLRITSMLVIVLYHLIVYSIIPNNPDLSYISNTILIFAHMGVISYVLISGYWGLTFSLKKFLKLFLYGSLYSLFIFLTGVLLNPELFTIKDLFLSFIPPWWVRVYLFLYLLSPIINIPLKTASNRRKIIYIVILIALSFPLRRILPPLPYVDNPFSFLLIYYYVGNFLRTGVSLPPSLNLRRVFLIYILCNVLLLTSMLLSSFHMPIITKIIFRLFIHYNGLGLIINSAFLLLLVSKMDFHSKPINWISSSTLAVYFIHENSYFHPYLYNYINKLQSIITNPAIEILLLFPMAILVFLMCVIIDKLISPLFYLIIAPVSENKRIANIDSKIKNFL